MLSSVFVSNAHTIKWSVRLSSAGKTLIVDISESGLAAFTQTGFIFLSSVILCSLTRKPFHPNLALLGHFTTRRQRQVAQFIHQLLVASILVQKKQSYAHIVIFKEIRNPLT